MITRCEGPAPPASFLVVLQGTSQAITPLSLLSSRMLNESSVVLVGVRGKEALVFQFVGYS